MHALTTLLLTLAPPPFQWHWPAVREHWPHVSVELEASVQVGALVGGGTAAGVAVATRDDTTTNRTVVVGASTSPVRNTSVINQAEDVQAVLSKVDGAVVAIQSVGSALAPRRLIA